MKNLKVTKIFVLALSMALLMTAAFCLGSSAAEDTSLKIIAKNVSHEAEVKIVFAVDETSLGLGEEATVVYTLEDPAVNPETEIYTATEYTKGYTDNGTTYPAFITAGFPGAKFDKYVYAAAVVKGTELTQIPTNFVRYSVLEYLNERLYEDTISDDQELLCSSLLNYGAMAQKLLLNQNDDLGDNITDDTLMSKKVRVSVTDGRLDEKTGGLTFESGMYFVGDKVVLAGSGDYQVVTYKADGSTEKATASAGSEITIGGRTVIAPKTIGAGDYFEELGGLDFETATKDDLKNKKWATRGDYYMSEQNASTYTGNYGTVSVLDLGDNKVIEFYYKGTKDRACPIYMDTNVASSSNDYNCFVFETDIYLADINATNAASIAAENSPYIFWFELANLASNYAPGETDPFNDAALPDIACIAAVANGDSFDYYLAPCYGKAELRNEQGKFVDGKNTITFEVYGDAGKVKMFLNGTFVTETALGSGSSFDFSSTIATKLNFRKAQRESTIYLDNTFVGKLNKAYVAE